APRGLPQIEVEFDIDANGILNVSARDKATGKEQKITIQASSGLSKDEIDRMVRDAEAHADADRQRREAVEERNRADNLAYAAEKLIAESGHKLPSHVKQDLESQLQGVRRSLDSSDAEQIKSAAGELEAAMQRAGQAVYASPAEPAAAGTAAGTAAGEPGTVEGEFREV